MKLEKQERLLLLGASRGLGKAFEEALKTSSNATSIQIYSLSRKTMPSFDFANSSQWEAVKDFTMNFNPTRIFYFAGGGPYGPYAQKEWKDHEWSFKVNFLFPAFLLHAFAAEKALSLKQFCVVGSAIAESKMDKGAASYCAGKHALKGLVITLQAEAQLPFDLRLFSPGYMDTGLIPKGAWPREKALTQSPQEVAQQMLAWIQSPNDANGHFVIHTHS